MKKALTWVLLVICILAFAGCNNNSDNKESTETDSPTIETIAVDKQATSDHSFIKVDKTSQLTPAVFIGGYVYAGDSTGLWRTSGDEKEYLSENKAEDITTNGSVILYRVGSGRGEEDNPNTRKNDYEIHQINCDGTENKELTKCSQDARPLMIYDNTLYYLDHLSKDTVDYSLYSVNISTGQQETLVEYVADDIAISGRKIYFFSEDFDSDFGNFYYYDTETTGKIFVSSDFDTYKLYSDSDSVYTLGRFDDEYDYSQCDLCSVNGDSYDVKAHFNAANSVEIQQIHNGIVYYRNNKGLYNQYDNYVMSLSNNESKQFENFPYDCSVIPMGTGVLYSTANLYFYYDGDSLKNVKDLDPKSQTILCTDGKRFYYTENSEIKSTTISLSDDLPEVEEPTDPPEKTPSQVSEYVYTEKEYKLPYYGSFYITGQEGSTMTYLAPRRLPQLKIDSDDARSINAAIHEKYDSTFEWYADESIDFAVDRTDYVVYQNGNVLSLVIETSSINTPNSWIDVYNIDVNTGKKVSKDELVGMSDISLEEAYALVYSNIEDKFNQPINIDNQEEYIKTAKNKSLSEDNIHSTEFYFNGDGHLVASYRYYWIAGASNYGELLITEAKKKYLI